MRYGLLADIHGNLEALEHALHVLAAEGAEELLCLGDVIGYNANPAECVDLVRERCSVTIKGNHERMVLGGSLDGVRQETIDATTWTRLQLSEDQLAWLEALPETARVGGDVLMVHGSPVDPDEYILTTDAIRESMSALKRDHPGVRICFYGHTHFPMFIGLPELHMRFHEQRTLGLRPDRIYLINPGSVGQPRDGCAKTAFALYDTDAAEVTFYRGEHDVKRAQDKIRAAGLSERFASRLGRGK